MELIKAYRVLQLNPRNLRQMTAFEALCWHLIRERADGEWVNLVQNDDIQLAWIVGQSPGQKLDGRNEMNHTMHDETIDLLTEEFINAYGERIWPWEWNKRAHLADTQDTEIKYVPAQYHARRDMLVRLETIREVHRTVRMKIVESKMGRLVREFLKQLLMERWLPEQLDDSPEYLLSVILDRVPTQRWPCMQAGCRVDCSSSTTLAIHKDAHHAGGEDEDSETTVSSGLGDTQTATTADEDSEMTDSSGLGDTQTGTIVPSHPEITSERFLCSYPGCNQVYAWKNALFAHEAKANHTVTKTAALSKPRVRRIKKPDQPPKSAEGESHVSQEEVLGPGRTHSGRGNIFPNLHQDDDDDLEVFHPTGLGYSLSDSQPAHEALSHPEVTSERFPCPHPGCSRIFASREALFTHTSLPHTIFRNATLSQPSPENIDRPDQSPKSVEGEMHDDGQVVRGLGCTKPGCGRRFPSFSLFETHEQQHEKDISAGGIDSSLQLDVTSGSNVHVDSNEISNAEAQQESIGVHSEPDTNHLWGELFGEEN